MNVELAAKFNALGSTEFERQALTKFGPMYARLVTLGKASMAALEVLSEPRKDQLQLLFIAQALLPLVDISGMELESEWVLFQCWLTKLAGLDIEGVQAWNEYFFVDEDITEEERNDGGIATLK